MAHSRKNMLTILLTSYCNLACTYCITGIDHRLNGITIDPRFGQLGIDYFFEKAPSRWIRFYGIGEPTMAFEEMKFLSDYARKKAGSSISIELQCNGTFNFSQDILDWVSLNVDYIYISFDGLPDVHDKNRLTADGELTSKVVISNIKHLLEKKRFVAVRATITLDLLYRQIEMIDFLASLGVRFVFSKNVLPKLDGSTPVEEIEFMEYARTFVQAHHYAKSIGIFYGNCYMAGFDEKSIYYCRSCLSTPHLTPDGFISCCDRAFSGKTPLIEFIYGYYDYLNKVLKIDQKKVERIKSRSLLNLTPCSGCEIGPYCCGSCAGTAYQKTGDLLGVAMEYCKGIKYMFRNINWKGGFFPCFHP